MAKLKKSYNLQYKNKTNNKVSLLSIYTLHMIFTIFFNQNQANLMVAALVIFV
jgi:hypothetical protein